MPETSFDSGTKSLWHGPKYNYTRVQGELTTSSATLFENTFEGVCIIEGGVICERSGVARTFTLRFVKEGTSDTAACNIFTTIALEANESFVLPFPIVLQDGDILKGLASANSAVTFYFAIRKEV